MFVSREDYTVKVEGNTTKFDDYDIIKAEIEKAIEVSNGKVIIIFQDAQSLASALIGYLINLRRVEKVDLEIIAFNHKLYSMLDTLSLVDILNVKKG